MPSDPSAPPPAADDWVVWLNEAPLGLSPEVRKVRLGADRILVHYQPGRRSLVLTAAEWRVLQRFQGARPVPVVLRELLGEQVCPPLRDFYELVAQALRAGILTAAGRPPPPAVAPTRWPLRLPGGFARGLALLAMPSAVGGLMLRPLGALPAWADALAGG